MSYNDVISRSDAEALIPIEVSSEIIAALPENSVIMKMGQKLSNMATNQRKLPVMSALPVAYFVDEAPSTTEKDSYKQTTKVEWEGKYIYAKEIAAIVPIPESVLDDSTFDIWGQTKPSIIEALGQVFDAAVLYGTNAPSDWPTNLLTGSANAGHTVALGTGSDLYEDLLGEAGVIAKIEEDGFMATGHIGALRLRGKLRGLRDENNQPIFTRSMQDKTGYDLDGAPIAFPLNGSIDSALSLMFTGQWNKLVYSIRQDVSYKVLDQAVITDPNDSNKIIYNLSQQDMVALRVTIRLGWQLPNPINRINSSSTTRYPFAVLTPAASA
jgi:HK97 family phage major capsid protein